jgi:DNA-directed RNA polymerase specialized sigma24 family protein
MPKSLTSESLAKLLKTFSLDETEAAFAYTKLHDSLVRYFRLKGIADADEAADATIDRVADKINQNTKIEDLTKYAFGVAKNIFLERLRSAQIRTRANDEFYLKSGAFQNFEEPDRFDSLRQCFGSLYEDEQKLLLSYFADLSGAELFENRQKLAERQKITLNTLRNRVSRLRKLLEDCVREIF